MIDRRKPAFAIISNANVPCQVRRSPPSYGRRCLSDCIYTFFSFQLHANCRALHNYTLQEKKKAARGEGPGFDGELNNFQAPQLSSLAKLVSILVFVCCYPLQALMARNAAIRTWMTPFGCDTPRLHFQFSVSYLCIIYQNKPHCTCYDHQTV